MGNNAEQPVGRAAVAVLAAAMASGLLLCAGLAPANAQAPAGRAGATFSPAGAAAAARPMVDKAALDRAEKLFLEGRKQYRLRRFRKALSLFSRAYEMAPLPGFMFNIGQCHRFLGDLEKAIFFYSQYVRDNPGTPDAAFVENLIRRLRARLRAESEKREKARQLFEEGRKRLNLRQFHEALRFFTQAYKVFPLAGYLYNIAEAHRGLGRCAEAIPFYRNYLKENPAAPRSRQVQVLIDQCERQLEKERARRRQQDRLGKAIAETGEKPVQFRTRPFYKKWWFWTAVAVGVGTAVGLGVGLGLRERGTELPVPALGTGDWRK